MEIYIMAVNVTIPFLFGPLILLSWGYVTNELKEDPIIYL